MSTTVKEGRKTRRRTAFERRTLVRKRGLLFRKKQAKERTQKERFGAATRAREKAGKKKKKTRGKLILPKAKKAHNINRYSRKWLPERRGGKNTNFLGIWAKKDKKRMEKKKKARNREEKKGKVAFQPGGGMTKVLHLVGGCDKKGRGRG